jgi:hypothetical protein
VQKPEMERAIVAEATATCQWFLAADHKRPTTSTTSAASATDGNYLRKLPLSLRKTNLARLLARRPEGIFLSDFEQGEIGPDLFRHACKFGLEALVSKHRDSTYRGGRLDRWVKVKNRQHPAFSRVMEQF